MSEVATVMKMYKVTTPPDKPVLSVYQIYRIAGFRLLDKVPMLKRDRDSAEKWVEAFKNFSECSNNYMAMIVTDRKDALTVARKEISNIVRARGWPPENFTFLLLHEEVRVEGSVMRFWVTADSGSVRVMKYEDVVPYVRPQLEEDDS